jgi:aspartyl-tRNA(Asn)/glutamyl-tRNA(Gln) amidotransferase subunit C
MKKIDKSLLLDASTRLLFVMTDTQYDVLINEFDILLKQMALIGKIEGVDHVSPMTFPIVTHTSQLRDDVPTITLKQSEATQNAKFVSEGQIKLPKVVG